MGINRALAAAVAVLAWSVAGTAVRAEETGVAVIHPWVKVGGKTCFTDHFHYGAGTGATRRQAEAAAIRAWVDFTAWEYGSSWGRYALSASKSMSCSKGSGWTCDVSARPCRAR